jgi:hypothetical protein
MECEVGVQSVAPLAVPYDIDCHALSVYVLQDPRKTHPLHQLAGAAAACSSNSELP